MKLPPTTLRRYWRVYREIRGRNPLWHPAVTTWLKTADATWTVAAIFADDPAAQQVFADTGRLPGPGTRRALCGSMLKGGSVDPPSVGGRQVLKRYPGRVAQRLTSASGESDLEGAICGLLEQHEPHDHDAKCLSRCLRDCGQHLRVPRTGKATVAR